MSRFVVAITRWGPPLEAELQALAKLVGLVAFDLKLRIAGPTPVELARVASPDDAKHLLATLRARGHGAVACEASAVINERNIVAPRRFELTAEAFEGVDSEGRRATMPFAEILALLPARMSDVQHVSVTEEVRTFSPGRAAMSMAVGPLVKPWKTETKTETRRTGDVQRVLYVIRRSGQSHVLLGERTLRYDGLGSRAGTTTQESFNVLTADMRERAPHAFYDERLLQRRRNTADDLHLAAHLTTVGYLGGQL